jgi:hypothetical protein
LNPPENTPENTPPVKALLQILIDNLEDNSNVKIFDRKLKPGELRKMFKQKNVQIKNPSKFFNYCLTDSLKNELQNKLMDIRSEIESHIKEGEIDNILKKLFMLQKLIPYFYGDIERSFHDSVSMLENFLQELTHKVKVRFQEMLANQSISKLDLLHFTQAHRTLKNSGNLQQFFSKDTKTELVESFENWTFITMREFMENIEKMNDFVLIGLELQKCNIILDGFKEGGLLLPKIHSKYEEIISALRENLLT